MIKVHLDEDKESKKHSGDILEQQDPLLSDPIRRLKVSDETKFKDYSKEGHKKNLWTILRGRVNCHNKEIVAGDYSVSLDAIATGGRDKRVRLWDYERVLMI